MKQSVREARPPLTSYCKSGLPTATGCTSGSNFLESRVQHYLYDNTVSFQHPCRQTRNNGVSAAQRRLRRSNGRIRDTWWAMNEREANGNLRKLARACEHIRKPWKSACKPQKAARFLFYAAALVKGNLTHFWWDVQPPNTLTHTQVRQDRSKVMKEKKRKIPSSFVFLCCQSKEPRMQHLC